jgi:aspartyl-tRNA(Asn)/glutamyl-tRNA(Gln) amidotransferase subunit A
VAGALDVTFLSAAELRAVFSSRELSPVEAFDALAERIEAVDPGINAFTTLCLERARTESGLAETAYREGRARPLEGLPVGIKDFFDTEGVRTTFGSPMCADNVPGRDATAVSRLRDAGAIVVGKTATHEWAWGITSANPHFGPTRNPWSPDRISGGSSGGSAAALATGQVPLALGSDTGGSIRVPSAFCGTVGLKPTWGRISGAGAMALARSLDHPGPMARTPADAALLLAALAGRDRADPATAEAPEGDVTPELAPLPYGLRVGYSPDLQQVELAPDVATVYDDALRTLSGLGFELVEVSLPEVARAFETFGVIQRAEALHTHRELGLYPARREEYGSDVRSRLDLATETTLEDYLRATEERRRLRAAFARAFSEVDLLVSPVSAGPPAIIWEEEVEHLGQRISFRELVMSNTVPQDLTGHPACAVRAGFDGLGIPVAVQLTGPAWSEMLVLEACQAFVDATLDVQRPWPHTVASAA